MLEDSPYELLAYGKSEFNVNLLNSDAVPESKIVTILADDGSKYYYNLKKDGPPDVSSVTGPIPKDYWAIDPALSRKNEETRTWEVYLTRTTGGVAGIAEGSTVRGGIWYYDTSGETDVLQWSSIGDWQFASGSEGGVRTFAGKVADAAYQTLTYGAVSFAALASAIIF